MATYRTQLTGNQSFTLEFDARHVSVENPSGSYIYVRTTGLDFPNAQNADLVIAPYKTKSVDVNSSRMFAFAFSDVAIAAPTRALVTVSISDTPQGNSQDDLMTTINTQTQNLGSAAGSGSLTLANFSARAFVVSNIGGFFIYLKLNTLTAPNVSTADFVIAPYCYYRENIAPTTQFAWTITAPVAPLSSLFGGMTLTLYDREQS